MRVILLMVLAVLTATAQDTPQKGVNFYSRDKEAALGATLAAQVQSQTTALSSVAVRDFVNGMGSRLAAQIQAAPFPYTFAVIVDSGNATHEPIPLPGGHIFVPSDLILAANDEAEFAGMLTHAMVHISERHYTRAATRGEIANMATVPLIDMGGWTGYGIRQANSVSAPLLSLNFQRQFEIDADTLAIRIIADSGFDPSALGRYIERVQPAVTTNNVLAAFPSPEQRVSSMNAAIQALSHRTYAASDPDAFARIQEDVRRSLQSTTNAPQ